MVSLIYQQYCSPYGLVQLDACPLSAERIIISHCQMSQIYGEGIEQPLFEITMIISNQSNICHLLLKKILKTTLMKGIQCA